MNSQMMKKVSTISLIVTFGIIYGDIGTSPLYTMNAIVMNKEVSEFLVLGALSCIIWTLTLQTTIKYVILTLNADNNGEGGIFSLFALIHRKRPKWLIYPAIIGGVALLADGMITAPISITSAVEGLRQVEFFKGIETSSIMTTVIIILSILFIAQQFGTKKIGTTFGPIMFLWLTMLAFLGIYHVSDDWSIIKAFNPYYGIKLLVLYPQGVFILGAVFLCTTGAEALYSDLGHCGKKNIRVTWMYVKTCLILNYLGQGAYLLSHHSGKVYPAASQSVFFALMPQWFLGIGICIATAAAIIASQALISGSFTLVSEAVRLGLWPRIKISYPTEEKGQLYIPLVNKLLFGGCIFMVLFFQKSSNMDAAYGLAITLCMIATSILFTNYLITKRVHKVLVWLYMGVYLSIEFTFLYANGSKIHHGGYVTIIISGILFFLMYVVYKSNIFQSRYSEYVKLNDYLMNILELSKNKTIAKRATHLFYLTSSQKTSELEFKIIYSILGKSPKRANIYWFVHVNTLDSPYTMEYKVTHIVPNEIIRIDFNLGFRVPMRIQVMVSQVIKDLIATHEIQIQNNYHPIDKSEVIADYRFVVIDKILSYDNELPFWKNMILHVYFWIKEHIAMNEKGFNIDSTYLLVEKYPFKISPIPYVPLTRVYER